MMSIDEYFASLDTVSPQLATEFIAFGCYHLQLYITISILNAFSSDPIAKEKLDEQAEGASRCFFRDDLVSIPRPDL